MSDVIFVYGSLRSEFDNRQVQLLREKAVSVGRAAVRGSIFRVGKYPGYRTEPDGVVKGELWRLRDAKPALAWLDDYEGGEYSRVMIDLEVPAGSAWIYLYKGDVPADSRIHSGDFLAP